MKAKLIQRGCACAGRALAIDCGCVCVLCFVALARDHRLPRAHSFAGAAVWSVACALLVGAASREFERSASLRRSEPRRAAAAAACVFALLAGLAILAALDHGGPLPNRAAVLTQLAASALLGCYIANPKRVEALLKERSPSAATRR